MEPNREDGWVASRLAALEPQWQPDFAHGRKLLDAGLTQRTHSWSWVAAAAAAVICIAALAVPQTRVFAQQLWYRLVLHRVDVVRLDLSDWPLRAQVKPNGVQTVQDLDDAERKAGFRPYLPRTDAALKVIGLMAVEQTIHVRDIEAALRKVGASDVHVPPEWEGMQLRAEIGPIVEADYADGVQILQARPIELSVPAGFPLERFAEVIFRGIGVSAWEARALAQKFVANPALLLGIPADEVVNIQEVPLRTGPALLIEDPERATVIRSTSERIYAVSAKTRQLGLTIADGLP